MEYYVTQSSSVHFMIAKFGDKREPFDVYDVIGEHCNCPSPKTPCKHVIMLKEWVKLDIPSNYYYDVESETFVKHAFVGELPPFVQELLNQMEH